MALLVINNDLQEVAVSPSRAWYRPLRILALASMVWDSFTKKIPTGLTRTQTHNCLAMKFGKCVHVIAEISINFITNNFFLTPLP
jgi:hypothetical protein